MTPVERLGLNEALRRLELLTQAQRLCRQLASVRGPRRERVLGTAERRRNRRVAWLHRGDPDTIFFRGIF
jgi:hypothetical protein